MIGGAMNGVLSRTLALALYLAFAGAVMFFAANYLDTGGRIVAFLVLVAAAAALRYFMSFRLK